MEFTQMNWITPQEYNEAIQTPISSFSDPILRNGRPQLNALGLPHCASGTFASVYRLKTKEGDFAVRCPLIERDDLKSRYAAISDFVSNGDLECIVPFEYLEDGILVRGKWHPVIKMRWLEGETLDTYLNKHYRDGELMHSLVQQFAKLAHELEIAGIAHGDLQHGNILVCKKGLMLVDYDPLFVPALSGQLSLEIGHPNYQHPRRTERHYDSTVDNFSCWLIHTSLLTLWIDYTLYEQFPGGDDCILFKRKDLESPASSELFETLLNHQANEIRNHAEMLVRMLRTLPESIPELSASQDELQRLFLMPPQLPPENQRIEAENPAGNSLTKASKNSPSGRSMYPSSRIRRNALEKTKRFWLLSGKESSRIYRILMPGLWARSRIARADNSFGRADYDIALHLYREVYLGLESTAAWSPLAPLVYRALIGAGYCCGMLRDYSNAHNFLLLAHIFPSRFIKESDRNRTSFLLACNHCMANETAEASKLLNFQGSLLVMLPELIDEELRIGLINSPAVFSFLVDRFAEQRRSSNLSDLQFLEIGSACIRIYDSIASDCSLTVHRDAIKLLVIMSEQSICSEKQTESFSTFIKRIARIAHIISPREADNEYSVEELLGTEIVDLAQLECSAGIDASKFLHLCRLELSLQHLERVEDPLILLNDLNKLDIETSTRFVVDRLGRQSSVSIIELLLKADPVSDLTQYDPITNTSLRELLISVLVRVGPAGDTGRAISHFVDQGDIQELTDICRMVHTRLSPKAVATETQVLKECHLSSQPDSDSEWLSEVILTIRSNGLLEAFFSMVLIPIDIEFAKVLWNCLRAENAIGLTSFMQLLNNSRELQVEPNTTLPTAFGCLAKTISAAQMKFVWLLVCSGNHNEIAQLISSFASDIPKEALVPIMKEAQYHNGSSGVTGILQQLSINASLVPLVVFLLNELDEEIAVEYIGCYSEKNYHETLLDLAVKLGYSGLASYLTVYTADANNKEIEEELLRLQDFGHNSRTVAAVRNLILQSEKDALKGLIQRLVRSEFKNVTGKYVMVGRLCSAAIELGCLTRFEVVYSMRDCPLSLVWVYRYLTEEYDLVCLTETIQTMQLYSTLFLRIPSSEFFDATLSVSLVLLRARVSSTDTWQSRMEAELTEKFRLRISLPRG